MTRFAAIEQVREALDERHVSPDLHQHLPEYAALALLQETLERASNMRNASVPAEPHGVARIAAEQFDEALARVRAGAGEGA